MGRKPKACRQCGRDCTNYNLGLTPTFTDGDLTLTFKGFHICSGTCLMAWAESMRTDIAP